MNLMGMQNILRNRIKNIIENRKRIENGNRNRKRMIFRRYEEFQFLRF